MTVAAIVRLAGEAHTGQVDQQGRDYFDAHLRPIAEGALLFGEEAVRAAWLHDILEDTEVTAGDLATRGVNPNVIAAIESVTRREGEPYAELIQRSAADRLGRYVKLADNAWNIVCSPALAAVDQARAQRLLDEKYLPAREALLTATGLTLDTHCYTALIERLGLHVRRLLGDLPEASLSPRGEGHGWVVGGYPVTELYEGESGLVFQSTSSGGNVDAYLTLPFVTYPDVRAALRVEDNAEVLPAVVESLAGILAVGVPVWAEAHGIETESFTYVSNEFWEHDD